MFFGRYEHSLDTKGRVVLPAKYRAHFDTQAYLTENSEGCLGLWTPEAFDGEVAKQLTDPDRSSATERNRMRQWAASAMEVEIDRQGRVPIPSFLRAYAHLEGEGVSVLVTGAITCIELWAPPVYAEVVQPAEQDVLHPADPPSPVA